MKILNEIALTELISLIKNALSNKIDKVTGKGLSTNDFTTEEKTKLAGLSNTLPVAGSSLGGVKSGTDITVDANGNVSVNDGSHNHSASNITSGTLALDRIPSITNKKLASGAVTWEKFADDAKYSHNMSVYNTENTITAAHIGRTLYGNWDIRNSPVKYLFSQENTANMPTGAEIAIARIFNNSPVQIVTSGVRMIGGGDNMAVGKTYTLPAFGSMVALKKFAEGDGSYGDVWLITGDFE